MPMTVTLLPDGLHHAIATGEITIGAGFGEVVGLGIGQLMQLRLPFESRVFVPEGFEEQFFILAKSLDGNVGDVRLNAIPFVYDPAGIILRLDVDITAAPANTYMQLEAHHSVGR